MSEAVRLWLEAGRTAKYDNSIFLWIPKNAGTSVYQMLRGHGLVKFKTLAAVRAFRGAGRVTFGHIDIAALLTAGLVSRDFVDSAFKFAITRDPYARSVSLYAYLSKHVMANWRDRPDFRQFLRILADGHYDRIGLFNSRGLSQCNPQVTWLRAAAPDKLYKVEELDGFVADIARRWGVPESEMPHANSSQPSKDLNLGREEMALIEQIYAEDFEMLGYTRRRSMVSQVQITQ